VFVALNVPSPIRAALAVVPALELAALLPLTPANIGLASAAALHARGLATPEALQVGMVLHVVETAAGIAYGTVSALLCLVWLRRRTLFNEDIQLTTGGIEAVASAEGSEARAASPAKRVFPRLRPVRAPRAAIHGG
jgi:hypothetical protein